jgi:choline kinase
MNQVFSLVYVREYLSEKRRKLRIFMFGQIVGDSVYDCDLLEKLRNPDGAVALDLDERYKGWNR